MSATTPCGHYLTYTHGCRCLPCRHAWRTYQREYARLRRSGKRRTVKAGRARRHLQRLSAAGVGLNAVAYATDLNMHTVLGIRAGKWTRIRLETERRILAVTPDCREDGSFVPAGRTVKMIAALREEGFTWARLQRETGIKRVDRFGAHVRAWVEQAVERVWRRHMVVEGAQP